MTLLLWFLFMPGGPHGWGGHHFGFFPGFFFIGPALFWMTLVGLFIVLWLARSAPRVGGGGQRGHAPTPAPIAGDDDGTSWPDLDATSPARQRDDKDEKVD